MLLLAFLVEISLGACWHRNIWTVKVVKKKSVESSKKRQRITFTALVDSIDSIHQLMISS